jgi:ATP/maltotriose-dependent transcriptional regulator MalT
VDPVTSALGAGRGLPGVPTAAEISAAAAESARQRLLEKLTARELDVLRLMAQGASDAEIAAGLFVSLATARWHAANVRAKLGAKNRTQALLRAQELGLI